MNDRTHYTLRGSTTVIAASALVLSACGAGPTAAESTGSTEAAVSTSLTELQAAGGWTTCSTSGSNCGGAGGQGKPVQSSFSVGSYGGRSGSAQIGVGGGVSYGTAFWYKKMASPSYEVASVDYFTDFFIPAGTGYEAIEWDTQQVRSSVIYEFGWQANNTLGQWRIFNYAAGRWENSGIPWRGLAQGVWHSFHAHYRASGNTVYADFFVLDGVTYTPTMNNVHSAVPRSSYKNDDISIGLQLDQDKSAQTYAVYYDHVQLDYSDSASGGGGGGGGADAGGGQGCSAPSILEPTAGQSVGPAIQLRTNAPSCITATKCYLDGNPTPVASASSGGIDQWVSVALGSHNVECNGWDASGTVYQSSTIAFDRTY
jgi:hypothetical protein